jgi:hypothetical protein
MLPSRRVQTAYNARNAATSTSSTTATMTTAARTASGSCSNRPVRNNSVTMVRTATVRPETWVRAPELPFTAVLDRLPLTTIPDDSPAPMLAAPSPSSSRLASMS